MATRRYCLALRIVGVAIGCLVLSEFPIQGGQGSATLERAVVDVALLAEPTGWMGDGELGERYVSLDTASTERPHSPPTCIKISYSPGPAGWAGVFWQTTANNWGDKPGLNLSRMGFRRVTFWARGETGREVVEFRIGGIDAPNKKFRDSFELSTRPMVLTREWRQYMIALEASDLSSVINAFGWVASRNRNVGKIVFYLDDVAYEKR